MSSWRKPGGHFFFEKNNFFEEGHRGFEVMLRYVSEKKEKIIINELNILNYETEIFRIVSFYGSRF